MNAPFGLSKECVILASVQFVNAHQMKFLLSGNNSKNNRIQTWSDTQLSVHKTIVLSQWESGAHKMKTISRQFMWI